MDQLEQNAKMLVIAGSLREPSYSHSLASAISEAVVTRGGACSTWDLRGHPLPFADPAFHHRPLDHPDAAARSFVERVYEASSLVLITPIYHNGLSGVLKNALDLLPMDAVRSKAVGLASHGGARTTQAVEQLRIIVRGMQGLAITAQVCTAPGDYSEHLVNGVYEITNNRLTSRIGRFCDELIVMAALLQSAHQLLDP